MYFDLQYRCLFRIFISPYAWTKCKKDIVPAAHFKYSSLKQQQQQNYHLLSSPGKFKFFLVDFISKLLNQASSCCILENIFLRIPPCHSSRILTRHREKENIFCCCYSHHTTKVYWDSLQWWHWVLCYVLKIFFEKYFKEFRVLEVLEKKFFFFFLKGNMLWNIQRSIWTWEGRT